MTYRVTLLDHMDSFTHNLAHLLERAGATVTVLRCDRTSWSDLIGTPADLLVLSPGPGRPTDAVLARRLLDERAGRMPVFGVCLGMQIIGTWAGGQVVKGVPVHGKPAPIHHDGRGMFHGLPNPLTVGRYHSLHLASVPDALAVTATTPQGIVMAIRHRTLPVAGVQFHPESFLTEAGLKLAENIIHGHL